MKSNGKIYDGGGGRTRTYEVIRRLIYSQLPLPLGTLPRSTSSVGGAFTAPCGGDKAIDDTEIPAGLFNAKPPGRARLWAKGDGKVNQ